MSKGMRRIAASTLVALVGLVSLLAVAGSAMAQSVPDTLVSGTITGATSGTVTVTSGGTACTTVAGGTVSATGTYQIVVNCATGAGQVLLNGVAVSGATFSLVQGTSITGVNGTVGAAPTTTATTPAGTTPVAPKTGNTAPAGSSSPWLLVIAGLGVLALGVGGAAAVRKS